VAFWGLWQPAQRDWSSGGCELYGLLPVLLRAPDRVRGSFVVMGFDKPSSSTLSGSRPRRSGTTPPMTAVFDAAEDLGAELTAWWCSRRMHVASVELSKCTSLADARRWASARGLKLVVCEDVRDSCDIGAFVASHPAPSGADY
jgi:hypothetical protein